MKPSVALPRRIEALEVAVEAGDAEQVERQHEETIELLLRAPALDELADLAADRAEHLEQLRVGLADLAAEELHDAEHVGAEDDRKAERGVQPLSRGRGARGKVVVAQTSGMNAGWPLAQTRPGQPDAALEGRGAAERFEVGEARAGRMPGGDAAEAVGVGVDLPEGAVLPAERRADGFENARRRFGEPADSASTRAVAYSAAWWRARRVSPDPDS